AATDAIDAESELIDRRRVENVRLVPAKDLPSDIEEMAESRNGIAGPAGFDDLGALQSIVTMKSIAVCRVVRDIDGRLTHVNRRRRRTAEGGRAGRVDEVCPRNELEQFCD